MNVIFCHLGHFPYPSVVGTPVSMWGVLQALLKRGHQVTAVTGARDEASDSRHSRAVELLAQHGVRAIFLPELPPHRPNSLWKKAFRPDLSDLYPDSRSAPDLAAVLEQEKPDALICYHENSILTAHAAGALPPMMGIQVDIGTLEFRVQTFPPQSLKERVRTWLEIRADRERYRRLAKAMAEEIAPVSFAASTRDWLEQHGVSQARYYPMPIQDPSGPTWREEKDAAQAATAVPRILMVADFRGTSTRIGLKYFAEEILPHLDDAMGEGEYEVHVCGGGLLPPRIVSALDHPAVRLRGFVPDINYEFRAATMVLSPTPIVLGARTRVAEGFGYGCCFVAHQSEGAGMPEMIHDQTCLMGSSGLEIAELCARAQQNRDLRRRIECGARRSFEENYNSDVAGRRLIEDLERVVPAGPRTLTADAV